MFCMLKLILNVRTIDTVRIIDKTYLEHLHIRVYFEKRYQMKYNEENVT